jgi:hypothetical protein
MPPLHCPANGSHGTKRLPLHHGFARRKQRHKMPHIPRKTRPTTPPLPTTPTTPAQHKDNYYYYYYLIGFAPSGIIFSIFNITIFWFLSSQGCPSRTSSVFYYCFFYPQTFVYLPRIYWRGPTVHNAFEPHTIQRAYSARALTVKFFPLESQKSSKLRLLLSA